MARAEYFSLDHVVRTEDCEQHKVEDGKLGVDSLILLVLLGFLVVLNGAFFKGLC